METILIAILVGSAIAGIISLPARIPILRRNAQDSRPFRYGLVTLTGGVMFLITLLFMAWLSIGLSIGVALFYDDMQSNPAISDEVRDTYHHEYWGLWQELSLRLLVPFAHNHCFRANKSSDVCSVIDVYGLDMTAQFGVWVISLFFGGIAGAFTVYHTRDHRKVKQKPHKAEG
jgi:hypothetical protein